MEDNEFGSVFPTNSTLSQSDIAITQFNHCHASNDNG